jgi:hypothetical protein
MRPRLAPGRGCASLYEENGIKSRRVMGASTAGL